MPGYSGLYNGVYGVDYAELTNTAGNGETQISRAVARRLYGRAALRGILRALVNGAVGATAQETHARVKSGVDISGPTQGGLRVIETVNDINRATVAGDVTAMEAMLTQKSQPSSYPVDRSGNGGGSKRGY